MNLRRGFFRLWLIASFGFATLVGVVFFQDIRNAFNETRLYYSHFGTLWMPVLCTESRGVEGNDYHRTPWAWNNKICWYEESKFRLQYPEYGDLKSDEI